MHLEGSSGYATVEQYDSKVCLASAWTTNTKPVFRAQQSEVLQQ